MSGVVTGQDTLIKNFIQTGTNGMSNKMIAHGNVLYKTDNELFTPLIIRLSNELVIINGDSNEFRTTPANKSMSDYLSELKIPTCNWYPVTMEGTKDLKDAFYLDEGNLQRVLSILMPPEKVNLFDPSTPLPPNARNYYDRYEAERHWPAELSIMERYAEVIKRMKSQYHTMQSYVASYHLWWTASKLQLLLSVPEILEEAKRKQTINNKTLRTVLEARKAFDEFIGKVDGYIFAMSMFPTIESETETAITEQESEL